jgi:hypothetical protein
MAKKPVAEVKSTPKQKEQKVVQSMLVPWDTQHAPQNISLAVIDAMVDGTFDKAWSEIYVSEVLKN